MIMRRSIQNVFSSSFPFFKNFFFAFFKFLCVIFSFFPKKGQKKEKIPDIALRKKFLRSYAKELAKELFALLCERNLRKKFLCSCPGNEQC